MKAPLAGPATRVRVRPAIEENPPPPRRIGGRLHLLALCFALCSLARAQTPPNAPSQLGARPGPGRVLKFHMSWDAAHGYTSASVFTNVWRAHPAAGDGTIYRAQQTPTQIGCYIPQKGDPNWARCFTSGPLGKQLCQDNYYCEFPLYRDGGEPGKLWIYGMEFCDAGGCAPIVWEGDLSCTGTGSGCESIADFWPEADADGTIR